jgi:hypothetical protein
MTTIPYSTENTQNSITGKVQLKNGLPAAQVEVQLFRKTLQTDEMISSTITENDGNFIIEYSAYEPLNIVVRVFHYGKPEPVAESELILKAKQQEVVNLTMEHADYQGLSLFETVSYAIQPYAMETEIALFDAEQIKLLACESQLEEEMVLRYQKAVQLGNENALTTEAFFALLYNNGNLETDKLHKLSSAKLQHALAASWNEHVIPKWNSDSILASVVQHEQDSISKHLLLPTFLAETTLSSIWEIAKPSAEQLDEIGKNMQTSSGSALSFWDDLKNNPTTEEIVPQLQLLTQLNNLTLGNLPLVQQLQTETLNGSLEDLAGRSIDAWKTSVKAFPIPSEIVAKKGDPETVYATSLKRMVDYLYPTKNMSVSLGNDNTLKTELTDDYQQFFNDNPKFDFQRNNVEAYLEKNADALNKIKEPEALVEDLSKTIRLFRMVPATDTYEHIARLRDLKITSAADLGNSSFSEFSELWEQLGGDLASARETWYAGLHINAMVSNIVIKYQIDTDVAYYVFNNKIKDDSMWEDLFGSEDYCGCTHCKSVYSPAAYLADSLNFLDHRKLEGNETVLTELLDRRPDIQHILLNCENANTAMPYIDLVNEVLENAIAGTSNTDNQTTNRSAELMATPEHIKVAAYDTLKNAKYPWALPFDLNNRLGKTYLEHLGVDHHKIVALFPEKEIPSTDIPSPDGDDGDKKVTSSGLVTGVESTSSVNSTALSVRTAKAILNLNEMDWEIFTTENYTVEERHFWGYGGMEQMRVTRDLGLFMHLSQLALAEVKELVHSRFVNPSGKLFISFPNGCSTQDANMPELNSGMRQRLLQQVKLQKKLHVDLRTVDHILTALNATNLTENHLIEIAQLKRWHDTYHVPYTELVTWIGVIPTAYQNDELKHQELYEQLFLSNTEAIDDGVRKKFKLSTDKDTLAIESNNLTGDTSLAKSIRSYVLGAVGLSAQDLNAIIESLPSHKLTLANLSIIYGVVSQAKTLRISIVELLQLREIVPIDEMSTSETTQALIDFLGQLKTVGISVQQALFLFGKNNDEALTENSKTERLLELTESYWRFLNQGMENADETGEVPAVAPLTPTAFIVEKLSIAFNINRNVIHLLLGNENGVDSYLSYTDDAGLTASYIDLFILDFFVDSDEIESEEAPEVNPAIVGLLTELFDMLHKVSLLIKPLGFEERHFTSWLTDSGKSRWFDLNFLKSPDGHFVSFQRLLWISEIVGKHATNEINIFNLLIVRGHEAWRNQAGLFFKHSGIETLLNSLGIEPLNYSDIRSLLRIQKAIELEQHLGIQISEYTDSSDFFLWAHTDLDAQRVSEIVQVAKAKYGIEKWQQVTKQLRDAVREEQRDALISYAVSHLENANGDKLDSPDKLYAHFLLDVEMSACTVTSRIKLALSSVQLFVQRCLMNLESSIDLSGLSNVERGEWEEWNWRKNYRVWEANRKVYLYPENWLEPEWRDDKTPFFKDLETELQQNDLNNDLAEKAYMNYLSKLEEVSNMEIMTICEAEQLEDKPQSYYIFGRTYGTPKTLYFRKYTPQPESFTAWDKIDIDFEGEHLVPAIHKGRLHLFWPVFEEKSTRPNKEGGSYPQPEKYWSIRLAFTNYRNGNWQQKKITEALPIELDIPIHYQSPIYPLRWHGSRRDNKHSSRKFLYFSYTNSQIKLYNIFYSFAPLIAVADFSNLKPVLSKAPRVVRNIDGENLFKSIANYKLLPYPNDEFHHIYIVNQKLQTIRPEDSGQLVIKETSIHNAFDENVSCFSATDKEGLPFANSAPVIMQNEVGSILFKLELNEFGKFKSIPLQNLAYTTLLGDIASNGLRSKIIEDKWLEYQATIIPKAFKRIEAVDNISQTSLELSSSPAFSQYHWEIFFHIPMHIANKLRQEQKFEEAQEWFHMVFNPSTFEAGNTIEKFWLFQPFREHLCSGEDGTPCSIQELLNLLNEEGDIEGVQQFENEVEKWEENPFSPHTVARGRIVAYMKWVVMRYIDNLVEWADQLFRRDSIESLNEATQLYMLAWNILGPKGEEVSEQDREDKSYKDLKGDLDDFSNARVYIESRVQQTQQESPIARTARGLLLASPTSNNASQIISAMENGDINTAPTFIEGSTTSPSEAILNVERALPTDFAVENIRRKIADIGQYIFKPTMLYFCVPQNEKLLGYWDLVSDRFYKLRNCLNIEGVYRQLPLYEPPIDPALLIKARAAGLSISDALSSQYNSASSYRFLALLQKAVDYANDVRSFGGALLSALEKRDAEKMNLLRAQHEVQLLDNSTLIRKDQIKELQASNEALGYSMRNIEKRRDYYADKEFMSEGERKQQQTLATANALQLASQSAALQASIARAIPTIQSGISGIGGHLTTEFGGKMFSDVLGAISQSYSMASSIQSMTAAQVGQTASYQRRSEDWNFQASTAEVELKQMEKQMLSAEIRMAMTQQELSNHETQLDNSRKQLELVRTKFTDAELYDWMVGQLKTLYFQSYQMAFDVAKKAEQALRIEQGTNSSESFIQFGYWDNVKQGLLSGDKLHHDLKRMEMIYMQRNKRQYEISQTFSLAMIAPEELLRLRNTGLGTLTIPKALFDLAYPNHGNRKVKSVSITIPAITGPYTGVQATLRNGMHKMATSSAQNDNGLFQFNFNDERYLPFENIELDGDIEREQEYTTWDIEMNTEFQQFDYNSISDVLLHIHYTADDGEHTPIAEVLANCSFQRFFSLKQEFANEWFEALETGQLEVSINDSMFPYAGKNKQVEITTISKVQVPFINDQLEESTTVLYPEPANNEGNLDAVVIVPNGTSTVTTATVPNADDLMLVIEYNLIERNE